MENILQLAKEAGAKVESYMTKTPKPIAVYFTIEQLEKFVETIKNPSEVFLPDPAKIHDAGNSYDAHDNWCEGYDNGWNECLAEINRLNNL